jgi:hypothetical protein
MKNLNVLLYAALGVLLFVAPVAAGIFITNSCLDASIKVDAKYQQRISTRSLGKTQKMNINKTPDSLAISVNGTVTKFVPDPGSMYVVQCNGPTPTVTQVDHIKTTSSNPLG